MAHILNKLNAKFEDVKKQLEKDKKIHAENGMYLEHIWKNSDNSSEVFFLFRVDDLEKCKAFMKKMHGEALKKNPGIKFPDKIYLED